MVDLLERMTRGQLIAELRKLRAERSRDSELERLVHDLRVHEEQVQLQQDQLTETQQLLEASRDRYADLYDYAPLPYVTLDRNGVIEDINLTGADLLGRARPLLVGRPLRLYVDEADRRTFLDHMRRCRGTVSPVTTELKIKTEKGAVLVQLHSRRAAGSGKDAVGYRTAIVDLTARLEAEETRARAREERERLLKEEERLLVASEAKDHFLATLSHELRTPLAPVLVAVSALEGRGDVPATLRPTLAMIRRNVDLETRLIDDLLDLTRITRSELSMKPEILDVHEVVQEVVELCGNGRPAGVRVTAGLAAPAHHVRADPARLQQVFWNLLRNAFQSTPTDGEVTLRSSNDDAGRVRVVVEDTGGGIEAGDLERIFRPFYQGRAAGDRSGHLGLGLAIARSVIEAHGGRITAASEGKGSGARFTVELPTVAVEEARPPAPEAGSLTSSGLSILLIEDHADTALAVSEALRLEGYDVSVAGSVAAAVERAQEPYDVVISDLGLPDGNGLDLLRQLRSARPVKAIALSGFGSEKDVRACKEAGFDEHLTKPVTIETLTRTIESLMAHAEAATKRLVTPRRG